MAKSAGLGDALYLAGYDVSGDVGSIQSIHGGPALLDVTAINASAMERIGALKSGEITFNSYFNDGGASNRAGATGSTFLLLSALPTADVIATYFRGTTLGNRAAGIIGKQVNYDLSRGADGALAFAAQVVSNGYPLEWGVMLTAGKRSDTAATNGTSVDDLAGTPTSTAFGWSAYLQVFSFTGTSCTVKVQDSADNSTFADITDAAFTAATGITSQRLQASSATASVRRYLRVATTGTFSECTFAVVFVRHLTATL